MAKIKIDVFARDRGAAQDLLREAAREIGLGYSRGEGWSYNEEPEPEKESPDDVGSTEIPVQASASGSDTNLTAPHGTSGGSGSNDASGAQNAPNQ